MTGGRIAAQRAARLQTCSLVGMGWKTAEQLRLLFSNCGPPAALLACGSLCQAGAQHAG